MKIGFIGAGNMGGALACCVASRKKYDILLADKDTEKAKKLAERIGASVADSRELSAACDYIFLGVKPNLIGAVCEEIKGYISTNAVLVSMAAGVSLGRLEELFGKDMAIIRIMPNTPAAIGKGVVLVAPNARASGEAADKFTEMMSGAGLVDLIDEEYIDAASALSGCGPAFVYMFVEALANGAAGCGLDKDKALLYAASTAIGAAEMILATGKSPEQLKIEVCSPGGSTIEGVKVLDNENMKGIVASAVGASFEKTKKLGKA